MHSKTTVAQTLIKVAIVCIMVLAAVEGRSVTVEKIIRAIDYTAATGLIPT